jgi:hypothetical protein
VRTAVFASVLAFIALLAGLTISVAVEHGPDVLTIGSLLVLGMFAFGIVGALRHPDDE